MNRHLSRRERVLVSVAGVLCVCLAGYMFLLRPQLARMSSLRSQISQLTAETRLQQQTSSGTEKAASGQVSSSNGRGTAASDKVKLPNSADEAGLLQALYTMSKKSHVQITNLDALQDTKGSANATKSGLPSVHLQLVTQGSTASIEAFLASINQAQRLMDVENLSVQTAAAGKAEAQFDLYAYFTNH